MIQIFSIKTGKQRKLISWIATLLQQVLLISCSTLCWSLSFSQVVVLDDYNNYCYCKTSYLAPPFTSSSSRRKKSISLSLNSVSASSNTHRHNSVGVGGATNYRRQQQEQQQQGSTNRKRPGRKKWGSNSQMTFERAVLVEAKLVHALMTLRQRQQSNDTNIILIPPLLFPTTRECNAAIATFGNTQKFFMRGLQLFVKMRKVASLVVKKKNSNFQNTTSFIESVVPTPTLVTYSTLMSRAVSCNKPQVALRLWRLMTMQSDFFANNNNNINTVSSSNANIIVPDTKAVNILMNAYAKLGDIASAKALLQQMLSGGGTDVPPLKPNLITYNTLIDACRRAGDLKTGLHILQDMKSLSTTTKIKPDVRTYTTLISTVARKQQHKQNQNANFVFGTKDPDMAFALLYEMMQEQNLRPNGMTFCALIDVCGRCGRVDLAFVGLRIMLQQQKQTNDKDDDSISSVGAWTAAINACGKAGRYNTAIRLFKTMENFGAKPNIVTCGCLVDCLLRAKEEDHAKTSTTTIRIAETLFDLLRYMKENNMEPSEVMYTSLITSAGRLVRIEEEEEMRIRKKKKVQQQQPQQQEHLPMPSMAVENGEISSTISNSNMLINTMKKSSSASEGSPRAIDMYTELMKSMMRDSTITTAISSSSNSSSYKATTQNMLLKVFLVFQEMKGAGGKPDVACYNSLLRACARAGDTRRAGDVFREMERDGFIPNDVTWKQLLKAGARSKNSYFSQQTWNIATSAAVNTTIRWKPDVEAFEALIAAYWGEVFESPSSSSSTTIMNSTTTTITPSSQQQTKSFLLLRKVIELYQEVKMYSCVHTGGNNKQNSSTVQIFDDESKDETGLSYLNMDELHGNQRLMLMILHSAVSIELMINDDKSKIYNTYEDYDDAVPSAARKIAILISSLSCFSKQEKLPIALFFPGSNSLRSRKSLELARLWAEEERVRVD